MQRMEWYMTAAKNIGLQSLIRLQAEKHLRKRKKYARLTAKELRSPVWARKGSSDLYVFHDIFIKREYSCLDHVEKPALIIDCGANVGYSSVYFLSRYPQCLVISVEPDPENCALLQRNVAPYGNRCRVVQAAVWWRSEPLCFKVPTAPGAEWACSVDNANSAVGPPIEAVTIPELLQTLLGSRVSILKIDIEGSEYELFNHDTSWLDLVDNIVIELHGNACREKFFEAIERRTPTVSFSGELTCCVFNEPPK